MTEPQQPLNRWQLLLTALAAGLVLGCIVWVLLWAQSASQASPLAQQLAALTPGFTLRSLAEQWPSGELFAHFNLPLLAVQVWALWLLGTWGVGEWILERFVRAATHMRSAQNSQEETRPAAQDIDGLLPEERLGFGFACGFVAVGLLVLLAGLLHLVYPAFFWGLLVILAALGLAKHRDLREILARLPAPFLRPLARWPVRNLLACFFLAALLAGGLYALTPAIQSDAVRYHLAAPQEYLKAGQITYLPSNAFSNFPFLTEMHFLLALGTGSDEASQLMHFTLMLACATLILGFCRRFVDPLIEPLESPDPRLDHLARLFAFVGYMAIPASLVIASWPFVDHAVTLYFFGTLYGLLLAFRYGSTGFYALAGVMAGGALGSKYTALAFGAVLAVVVAAQWLLSRKDAALAPSTISLRLLAVCAAVALATGGVWFAKSAVWTANPVYPLANSHFGGGEWTPADAHFYQEKMSEKGKPKTVANLLRSPIDTTFDWPNYEGHFLDATLPGYTLAGLGALLVFAASRRTRLRLRPLLYLAAAAAGYYLLWFLSYQSNRMLLPFLAMMIPLAYGLLRLASRALPILSAAASAALLLGAMHGTLWALQWEYARTNPPVLPYLLGATAREAYLSRALNYYQAYSYLNERVRPDEKVLLIGEHRVYGARFHAVWSDWFDTPVFLTLLRRNDLLDTAQYVDYLRKQSIRWILDNQPELSLYQERYFRPRFTPQEWKLLQELLDSPQFERVTIPPGIVIYHLKGSSSGATRP